MPTAAASSVTTMLLSTYTSGYARGHAFVYVVSAQAQTIHKYLDFESNKNYLHNILVIFSNLNSRRYSMWRTAKNFAHSLWLVHVQASTKDDTTKYFNYAAVYVTHNDIKGTKIIEERKPRLPERDIFSVDCHKGTYTVAHELVHHHPDVLQLCVKLES